METGGGYKYRVEPERLGAFVFSIHRSVFEYSFWIIHHIFHIHEYINTKVFSNVFNTFEKYSVFNEYFMNTEYWIKFCVCMDSI